MHASLGQDILVGASFELEDFVPFSWGHPVFEEVN